MSKRTRGAYSLSGHHGGALPSFTALAIASFAAATAAEAIVWSGGRSLVTPVAHISSLPAEHGSAGRVRAATSTSPV